jgi:putative lipoprotein
VRRILLVAMVGVLAIVGAPSAGGDEPEMLTLTGTVVYSEPSAPPADALLTVTLEDVSLADAPAVTLGQAQFQLNGQSAPIPFSLAYPRSAVVPQAMYSARARLTQGDQLLFTTTQNNPVDPLRPVPLQLVLEPVAPPVAPPAPPATPDASLTDTYWKLVSVQGVPVVVAEQMREPHLVLNGQDGRFAGSGGVNRLMGDYTLTGEALTLSNAASTMMAGPPEAMAQEQAILAALPLVRGFRVTGNSLTLVDDAGGPVLQAVAVALN